MTNGTKATVGVTSHGGNHYATVNGFVYTLHGFSRADQAESFATTISRSPDFKPEAGWQRLMKFCDLN